MSVWLCVIYRLPNRWTDHRKNLYVRLFEYGACFCIITFSVSDRLDVFPLRYSSMLEPNNFSKIFLALFTHFMTFYVVSTKKKIFSKGPPFDVGTEKFTNIFFPLFPYFLRVSRLFTSFERKNILATVLTKN